MLLAVVIDVPERRIERVGIEVDHVFRLLRGAVLFRHQQRALIGQRIRPITSLHPVVRVVGQTDDQLFARHAAHRAVENAPVPADGGDRSRLAALAMFVVGHHHDEIADG